MDPMTPRSELSSFEEDVLHRLIALSSSSTLDSLSEQARTVRVVRRERTDVGFFVHLATDPGSAPVPGNPRLVLDGLFARIDGLPNGAGFVLFVENGYLSMLEGFTYGADWPDDVGAPAFTRLEAL